MSDSNDWEEMHQKRQLYLRAGTQDVGIVEQEGRVHFFEEQEIERSELAPEFPSQV